MTPKHSSLKAARITLLQPSLLVMSSRNSPLPSPALITAINLDLRSYMGKTLYSTAYLFWSSKILKLIKGRDCSVWESGGDSRLVVNGCKTAKWWLVPVPGLHVTLTVSHLPSLGASASDNSANYGWGRQATIGQRTTEWATSAGQPCWRCCQRCILWCGRFLRR